MEKLKKYQNKILIFLIITLSILGFTILKMYNKVEWKKEVTTMLLSNKVYFLFDAKVKKMEIIDEDAVTFNIIKGEVTGYIDEYLKNEGYKFRISKKNLSIEELKEFLNEYSNKNAIQKNSIEVREKIREKIRGRIYEERKK